MQWLSRRFAPENTGECRKCRTCHKSLLPGQRRAVCRLSIWLDRYSTIQTSGHGSCGWGLLIASDAPEADSCTTECLVYGDEINFMREFFLLRHSSIGWCWFHGVLLPRVVLGDWQNKPRPRFLAECRKRPQNQGGLLYYVYSCFGSSSFAFSSLFNLVGSLSVEWRAVKTSSE